MKQTNKGFAVKLFDNLDEPIKNRIELTESAIPKPAPGQVLVEVLAAPVNPSDLIFLYGKYGVPPTDGMYCGFEGCARVIKANAGLYGKWLEGKRVAVSAQVGYGGLWSRYAVTGANHCLPLRKELTDEQGATLIVNPLTSVCLVERAVQLKSKAVVINAAASQVGKGVIRYAKQVGLKTIATVRSQANVEVLKKLGADIVLLTTDTNFAEQLKKHTKELKARVLFDAVAAQDTALCLHNMPNRSTAVVYGRLTEKYSQFGGEYGVADLIFRDCKIEGFWLSTYVRRAKPWQLLSLSKKVQKLFAQGIFDTDIYGTFNFDEFPDALAHYASNKSDGKVILKPNQA